MKDGLYLTKKELKEYGILKKKRRKKRKYAQDERNPKMRTNTSVQGIRSTSDHMQGFGTQINRTNDLANELARHTLEKAEKGRDILAIERGNTAPLAIAPPPQQTDDTNERLNHVVNYLQSERSKMHKRLSAIETPTFRFPHSGTDGVGTSSFSSNYFRDHGNAFPVHPRYDPRVDKTFQSDDELSDQNNDDQDNDQDDQDEDEEIDEPKVEQNQSRFYNPSILSTPLTSARTIFGSMGIFARSTKLDDQQEDDEDEESIHTPKNVKLGGDFDDEHLQQLRPKVNKRTKDEDADKILQNGSTLHVAHGYSITELKAMPPRTIKRLYELYENYGFTADRLKGLSYGQIDRIYSKANARKKK